MGEYLGVTAAHVRKLSTGQDQAVTAIGKVADLTDGISASMWWTHGTVCAASNLTVASVHSARLSACKAMAEVSRDLSEKLDTAAERYDAIDAEMRRRLAEQMHP